MRVRMVGWFCVEERPLVTMLKGSIYRRGLSSVLQEIIVTKIDRHSARADSGRATMTMLAYTPLVEVNQALNAWSF